MAANANFLMHFFHYLFVFISGTSGFRLRCGRVKVYQKAFAEGTGILGIVSVFLFPPCPPSHLPLKNSFS